MSIVALKRKTAAKFNSANRSFATSIVSLHQPGPNAKRGLVAYSNSSVVNRKKHTEARTIHKHMENPQKVVNHENVNQTSGFSLNGKNYNKSSLPKDTNLMKQTTDNCCSEINKSVKQSVLTTKGMLDTRNLRFKKNNPDSKCCKNIVNTNIEKHTTPSSEVIDRRKIDAKSCVVCDYECPKPHNPECKPGCKNPPPVSHEVCVAIPQSDYLTRLKAKNEAALNNPSSQSDDSIYH